MPKLNIPVEMILPYVGKAYQFAVAKAKEWADADGVTDWKDYLVQIMEAIGESGTPGLKAAGDERLCAAVAEFTDSLEAE